MPNARNYTWQICKDQWTVLFKIEATKINYGPLAKIIRHYSLILLNIDRTSEPYNISN
jgi:hypothetical protein